MGSEERIRAEAQLVPQHFFEARGRALLERRGDALILIHTRGARFDLRCFDVEGATVELRGDRPKRYIYLALTVVFLLFFFGMPHGEAIYAKSHPHVDIGLLTVSAIVISSALAVNLRATPVAHLRFNTPDDVQDLTLKYTAGENLKLDTVLASLRPFAISWHSFSPGRYVRFSTDWLRAFPVRFAMEHGTLPTLQIILTGFCLIGYWERSRGELNLPHIPFWALALPVVAVFYYVRRQLRKDKVPREYRARQRHVMQLLAAREIDSAKGALSALANDYPGDARVLELLIQLNIATGHYDDVARSLVQFTEVDAVPRKLLENGLETMLEMECRPGSATV